MMNLKFLLMKRFPMKNRLKLNIMIVSFLMIPDQIIARLFEP